MPQRTNTLSTEIDAAAEGGAEGVATEDGLLGITLGAWTGDLLHLDLERDSELRGGHDAAGAMSRGSSSMAVACGERRPEPGEQRAGLQGR